MGNRSTCRYRHQLDFRAWFLLQADHGHPNLQAGNDVHGVTGRRNLVGQLTHDPHPGGTALEIFVR